MLHEACGSFVEVADFEGPPFFAFSSLNSLLEITFAVFCFFLGTWVTIVNPCLSWMRQMDWSLNERFLFLKSGSFLAIKGLHINL